MSVLFRTIYGHGLIEVQLPFIHVGVSCADQFKKIHKANNTIKRADLSESFISVDGRADLMRFKHVRNQRSGVIEKRPNSLRDTK